LIWDDFDFTWFFLYFWQSEKQVHWHLHFVSQAPATEC
jgi:hypothetical protein